MHVLYPFIYIYVSTWCPNMFCMETFSLKSQIHEIRKLIFFLLKIRQIEGTSVLLRQNENKLSRDFRLL